MRLRCDASEGLASAIFAALASICLRSCRMTCGVSSHTKPCEFSAWAFSRARHAFKHRFPMARWRGFLRSEMKLRVRQRLAVNVTKAIMEQLSALHHSPEATCSHARMDSSRGMETHEQLTLGDFCRRPRSASTRHPSLHQMAGPQALRGRK